VQPKSLTRGVIHDASILIHLRHGLFSSRVDQQPYEIGSHIGTAEVVDGLWQMGLVQVNLEVVNLLMSKTRKQASCIDTTYVRNQQAPEVFVRSGDASSIG
jgi:hypothetical protein